MVASRALVAPLALPAGDPGRAVAAGVVAYTLAMGFIAPTRHHARRTHALELALEPQSENIHKEPEGMARVCHDYQLPPGTVVALETGTSAFYVARALVDLHLNPVVSDANEVRLKAHRPAQKSDRRDAFELCDRVRCGLYRSIVHIPSPAISRLRTALSRRRHFIRVQTAEINASKRLLRGAGWLVGTRASLRSAGSWDRLLDTLAVVVPELQAHLPLPSRRLAAGGASKSALSTSCWATWSDGGAMKSAGSRRGRGAGRGVR